MEEPGIRTDQKDDQQVPSHVQQVQNEEDNKKEVLLFWPSGQAKEEKVRVAGVEIFTIHGSEVGQRKLIECQEKQDYRCSNPLQVSFWHQ